MDKIFGILTAFIVSISSFLGVNQAKPQVMSAEITVTATPIPTDTPVPTDTPTPIPTPWPTKVPATPTPDSKIQDLQNQIDDLKKQLDNSPKKYSCLTENGSVNQNEKCTYTCQDSSGNGRYSNVECNKVGMTSL